MGAESEVRSKSLGLLAELLGYPRRDTWSLAQQAAALADDPAAEPLRRFAGAAQALGGPALEELYTSTFDLDPACAPYLGVQLLGDDPRRGLFLSRLVEVYGAEGFAPREELADHLAEVLAFLAVARPTPARDDLVRDALLPGLERMIAALAGGSNPYRDVLAAARAVVEAVAPAEVGAAVAPAEVGAAVAPAEVGAAEVLP